MQAERIAHPMKTTRTGLDAERAPLRRRYAEARGEGASHDEARSTAAKGLPLHKVDDWTADLRETFDGSDDDAKNLAFVYAVLQAGGHISKCPQRDGEGS